MARAGVRKTVGDQAKKAKGRIAGPARHMGWRRAVLRVAANPNSLNISMHKIYLIVKVESLCS
jgi:hypothetical protein